MGFEPAIDVLERYGVGVTEREARDRNTTFQHGYMLCHSFRRKEIYQLSDSANTLMYLNTVVRKPFPRILPSHDRGIIRPKSIAVKWMSQPLKVQSLLPHTGL